MTTIVFLCFGCSAAPKQIQTLPPITGLREEEQKTPQQPSSLVYQETQTAPQNQTKSDDPDWVLLGTARGMTYYVDLRRELVSGSLWVAPALVVDENGVKAFGKIAINCSNQTYKARFGNHEIDWSDIGEGSPVGDFVENVCR